MADVKQGVTLRVSVAGVVRTVNCLDSELWSMRILATILANDSEPIRQGAARAGPRWLCNLPVRTLNVQQQILACLQIIELLIQAFPFFVQLFLENVALGNQMRVLSLKLHVHSHQINLKEPLAGPKPLDVLLQIFLLLHEVVPDLLEVVLLHRLQEFVVFQGSQPGAA